MSDTNVYYVEGQKLNIPYEKTVIEKRAPTDDSIRLYEEIKEKAYNSILDTIEINDNILNLKAIIYSDCTSFNSICKYHLTLNSEVFTDKIVISEFELKMERDKGKILRKIVEDAAKELTKKILMAGIEHGDSYLFRQALGDK